MLRLQLTIAQTDRRAGCVACGQILWRAFVAKQMIFVARPVRQTRTDSILVERRTCATIQVVKLVEQFVGNGRQLGRSLVIGRTAASTPVRGLLSTAVRRCDLNVHVGRLVDQLIRVSQRMCGRVDWLRS